MQKYLIIAAVALATTPALAAGSGSALTETSVLGTTVEEVTAALAGMGYEVRKTEMEDGKIEVYFVKDKTMGEVYVSPETGEVVKLEMK